MNKIVVSLLMVFVCFYFSGCSLKTDYSEFSFTDVSWVRDAEHDTETIRFGSDGSFWYSCGCGNPVNDSDLCEVYSYDDETKMIKLDCFEPSMETITNIKVLYYDENSLKLDFNGEIREFVAE